MKSRPSSRPVCACCPTQFVPMPARGDMGHAWRHRKGASGKCRSEPSVFDETRGPNTMWFLSVARSAKLSAARQKSRRCCNACGDAVTDTGPNWRQQMSFEIDRSIHRAVPYGQCVCGGHTGVAVVRPSRRNCVDTRVHDERPSANRRPVL